MTPTPFDEYCARGLTPDSIRQSAIEFWHTQYEKTSRRGDAAGEHDHDTDRRLPTRLHPRRSRCGEGEDGMIRIYTDSGLWLWIGKFGLLVRRHDKYPPLFSERYTRGGLWVRRFGRWRVTLRWPAKHRLVAEPRPL